MSKDELTPMRPELTEKLENRKARMREKLGYSWYKILGEEFEKEYMQKLSKGIANARKVKRIYPASENLFRAFKLCPFDMVKVVFMGQDPYNNGAATGLAFESPAKEVSQMQPSLIKMMEVYDKDYPHDFNTKLMDGELDHWAKQGVLLLNASLTVPHKDPGKHLKHWKPFTRRVLESLIFEPNPKVFVFLGKPVHEYATWVMAPHLALCYEHPAYAARQNRGWDAEGVFKKINAFLIDNGRHPVEW